MIKTKTFRFSIQKFKCFRLVFCTILLLIPAGPARGADWRFYSANEHYFCLYDPWQVSRPDPEVVQVWTNWIATKEGKKQRTQEMARMKVPKSVAERYESTRVRMAIHCTARTYQILALCDYDDQQREIGNGSRTCVLPEFTTNLPIGRNSSEEDLHQILCGGGQKGNYPE